MTDEEKRAKERERERRKRRNNPEAARQKRRRKKARRRERIMADPVKLVTFREQQRSRARARYASKSAETRGRYYAELRRDPERYATLLARKKAYRELHDPELVARRADRERRAAEQRQLREQRARERQRPRQTKEQRAAARKAVRPKYADKLNAYDRAWRATNIEKYRARSREQSRRFRQRYPEKELAKSAVVAVLRARGVIPRHQWGYRVDRVAVFRLARELGLL
jgi:hypothetical protein